MPERPVSGWPREAPGSRRRRQVDVADREADEESDVDVFVLLRTAGWAERRAVLDVAGDLFYERDLLISPTVFDAACYEAWRRQERPLVMDIERDGVRP